MFTATSAANKQTNKQKNPPIITRQLLYLLLLLQRTNKQKKKKKNPTPLPLLILQQLLPPRILTNIKWQSLKSHDLMAWLLGRVAIYGAVAEFWCIANSHLVVQTDRGDRAQTRDSFTFLRLFSLLSVGGWERRNVWEGGGGGGVSIGILWSSSSGVFCRYPGLHPSIGE